jgi:hypothetical protein
MDGGDGGLQLVRANRRLPWRAEQFRITVHGGELRPA